MRVLWPLAGESFPADDHVSSGMESAEVTKTPSRSSCKHSSIGCHGSAGAQVSNTSAWQHVKDKELVWLELREKTASPAEFRFDVCLIGGDWSPSSSKLITHCAISQSVNQYVAARGCLFSHCDEDYSGSWKCPTWCGWTFGTWHI